MGPFSGNFMDANGPKGPPLGPFSEGAGRGVSLSAHHFGDAEVQEIALEYFLEHDPGLRMFRNRQRERVRRETQREKVARLLMGALGVLGSAGLLWLVLSEDDGISGTRCLKVIPRHLENLAFGDVFRAIVLEDQHLAHEADKGQGVLERIAMDLVRAVPLTHSAIKWEFHLVESDIPNAVSFPGGLVLVNKGLMTSKVVTTEAELAAVIAHEMGHVLHQHGVKKLSLAGLVWLWASVLGGSIPSAGEIILHNPYSRANELDADKVSLFLMNRACYDCRVAPAVMERLGALDRAHGHDISYLQRTHPMGDERAEAMKAIIPTVLATPSPCSQQPVVKAARKVKRGWFW